MIQCWYFRCEDSAYINFIQDNNIYSNNFYTEFTMAQVHNIIYSPKKVMHNILVYRQAQISVAVTCVLYISYIMEYKE